MASKYLFFPLFLALCYLSATPATQVEAGGSQVVIHFISAVPSGSPAVTFHISGGADVLSQLSPGQKYEIKTDVNKVDHVSAGYGRKFTYFDAYVPARDKGRAAVYWRIDNWGFAISYDNTHFKNVAPWETE